jgi:hypothetical protein
MEYNLRRQYETMHKEKLGHLEGKLRKDKFNVSKSYLQRQQNVFTVTNKSSGLFKFCSIENYCKMIETIYGW